MLELRRWPAFCNVFWRVRSCSWVLDVDSAVTVLARGDVRMACSEEGSLGSDGLVGGDRRKEFLRMPRRRLGSSYMMKTRSITYLSAVVVARYACLEKPGSCLALVRDSSWRIYTLRNGKKKGTRAANSS